MARNLEVGENVLVPRARLNLPVSGHSALYRTKVERHNDRSIRVTLPNGQLSAAVASSAVHRNLGLLVVRIGDFATEETLLDPLGKSVLQFLRLLLPDDSVVIREVRSIEELSRFWANDHAAHSHMLLIGHGRKDGIRFGVEDWIGADRLVEVLGGPNPEPKVYLSLCCQHGYASFARVFSRAKICEAFIAPFHDVHGAVASQFCQTYLSYHLLEGETVGVAYKHAREAVPGGSIFRMWKDGALG